MRAGGKVAGEGAGGRGAKRPCLWLVRGNESFNSLKGTGGSWWIFGMDESDLEGTQNHDMNYLV